MVMVFNPQKEGYSNLSRDRFNLTLKVSMPSAWRKYHGSSKVSLETIGPCHRVARETLTVR